jgi:hypothetical protein
MRTTTVITAILALALAATPVSAAVEPQAVEGTIGVFECNENDDCFLTVGDEKGNVIDALCNLPLCDEWHEVGEMPERYAGRPVQVTIEQGMQRDTNGTILGGYPEITAMRFTDLEGFGDESFFFTTMIVVTKSVHSVKAPPPPAGYDRPYPNVEIVYDLHGDDDAWGRADPPTRPGGRCTIHLAPLGRTFETKDGTELLEPVGLPKLIAHEMAHCWGLEHVAQADGTVDHTKWVLAPNQQPKTATPAKAPATPVNTWPGSW